MTSSLGPIMTLVMVLFLSDGEGDVTYVGVDVGFSIVLASAPLLR